MAKYVVLDEWMVTVKIPSGKPARKALAALRSKGFRRRLRAAVRASAAAYQALKDTRITVAR